MKPPQSFCLCAVLALAIVGGLTRPGIAQEPSLTPEAMEHFLLTAEVLEATPTDKGITRPWRLTLSDGTVTHDAQFQSVDDRRSQRVVDGVTVLQWADSYKFNIAGYRLARLLGLGHMVPVTVPREWRGAQGALSWWLPVVMDEQERQNRDLEAPNVGLWRARYRMMRIFGQLVRDTDRNMGNILYDAQWRLWMIDFTRAFRISEDVENIDALRRMDGVLFSRLQRVTDDEIRGELGPYLTDLEMTGLLARRAKIVSHIERLIEEVGAGAVLYSGG